MTTERFVFIRWLDASEKMNSASGKEHEYWLGKVTGYCEILADMKGITFIEANRLLMNMREEVAA